MNNLVPAHKSHTLVQKNEFSNRLEVYRCGHPFLQKYIGMHNPYTGQTIQTEADYDDYLREYVFHTVCDEAYHKTYRDMFRRKIHSVAISLSVLFLAFLLVLFGWVIPHIKTASYSDGYTAGIDYASASTVVPAPSVADKTTDPPQIVSGTTIVYVTDTGKKYHRSGCQYLSYSSNSISLSNAISQGYTPCLKCHPPRLE